MAELCSGLFLCLQIEGVLKKDKVIKAMSIFISVFFFSVILIIIFTSPYIIQDLLSGF